MNYKQSPEILKEIKKAKRILINLHKSPDPDSVGSATALSQVLKKLGKEVVTISPSEVPDSLFFLKDAREAKKIDFENFDFSKYDLFICLDSSEWKMVTGSANIKMPSIPLIVIDHHKTNTGFGNINLVDENISSVSELLYLFIEDCNIEIDKDTATSLLTGILADTGVFEYPSATTKTFDVARDLMALGADKDEIIFECYKSDEFGLLKFYGEVLKKMKFDKKHSFIWSAIPYDIYSKYSNIFLAKESAASLFASRVKNTNFGIIMVEKDPEDLSVSFRSRTDVDVSKMAVELSGGGHGAAAGAKILESPFKKAVERVLKVARKYAEKYKKV